VEQGLLIALSGGKSARAQHLMNNGLVCAAVLPSLADLVLSLAPDEDRES
jgi:hypothetical protein